MKGDSCGYVCWNIIYRYRTPDRTLEREERVAVSGGKARFPLYI